VSDTFNTEHAECRGGMPRTVSEMSANFTLSGEWSPCIVRYGVLVGRCHSFIGRNVVILCSHFNWQFDDFVCGDVSLNCYEFLHNVYSRVENDDWSAAQLPPEILRIRDDDFRVMFSDGRILSTSELNCILSYVSSSRSCSQFLIFFVVPRVRFYIINK